eukprot:s127_g19.t1
MRRNAKCARAARRMSDDVGHMVAILSACSWSLAEAYPLRQTVCRGATQLRVREGTDSSWSSRMQASLPCSSSRG